MGQFSIRDEIVAVRDNNNLNNRDVDYLKQSYSEDSTGNVNKGLEILLDELALRKRLQDEGTEKYSLRGGRRRKLNSKEQGMLLVEALAKKQMNYTGDQRGHPTPEVHNGIMDMLGRSAFFVFEF